MKIEKFNEKYKEAGGIPKLTEMFSMFVTKEYIAKNFGVSKERVKNWHKEFFKTNYDPRKQRRELIISKMVEFGLKNGVEEFIVAYQGKTKDYRHEAIRRINEKIISNNPIQ